jgi:hypothetical protein
MAAGKPGGENKLPAGFVEKVQEMVAAKYTEMLQHIRISWVFQKEEMLGWEIMDFAFTKMKQLAHVAEPVAENGINPKFKANNIDLSASIGFALKKALEDVRSSRERHLDLQNDTETKKHAGLLINLDLSVQQEAYEREEIEGWLGSLK